MPMTYRLGRDSKQFVVIAAGGHGRIGTKLGDSLVAFALPCLPLGAGPAPSGTAALWRGTTGYNQT